VTVPYAVASLDRIVEHFAHGHSFVFIERGEVNRLIFEPPLERAEVILAHERQRLYDLIHHSPGFRNEGTNKTQTVNAEGKSW
jgi:hypothetical protein